MKNQFINQQKIAPWLFISPFLILFLIFKLFPVAFNILLSFYKWRSTGSMEFTGLNNYKLLLFDPDPYFWKAAGNTGWLFITGCLIPHLFALPLAGILTRMNPKGKNFFITTCFLPFITSTVSITLLFTFFYNYQYGLFNYLCSLLGIPGGDWLQSSQALPGAVIILTNWKTIGFNTLLYMAGLQAIPEEIYEAAAIDATSVVKKYLYIIIPMLAPIIFFAVSVSILSGITLFTEPFLLTRGYMSMGGSGNSVFTLYFYIMWLLQWDSNYGKGAAVSVLLFLFLIILIFLNKGLTDMLGGERIFRKKKKIKTG